MVRPTFMGFETATRGLMTNQKAIDIVGQNVSNVGVTGYTRQRADLVSLNMNMKYTRYAQNTTSFAGQGSNVYGVSQIRDDFLDKQFRAEYADVGYYDVTSAVLSDLSDALDEVTPATMTTVMNRFMDAWDEMVAKGDEQTGAANVYAVAEQMVATFQQMSAKIDDVWDQYEHGLSLDVDNINSILERIAQLNDEIKHTQFNSMDVDNELYQPLELLDQRNVLLDELSEYANINYEAHADGQVTVWMGEKDKNNPPVVEGDKFDKFSIHINDQDEQFKTVEVRRDITGEAVSYDTGAIRGTLDMLNGRGLGFDGTKGETYTQGIHYYKDKIDEFARTIMTEFNNVIEELDPATGVAYDPPRYKALFKFDLDEYETAAGFGISDDWLNNPQYLITNVKDKFATDVEGGDSSNTYAAKVAQLFKEPLDFGEFTGTIDDYILFYSNTKLSNDKAFSDTRLDAAVTTSETVLNQIQQVSGVSMEEEGIDLMMYQKAYDAMSRVFTTLDELLDKLINGTGVTR